MCVICGCSSSGLATIVDPERNTHHSVDVHIQHDDQRHAHILAQRHGTMMTLEQEILGKNARFAERNRDWLRKRNILALNLMSSPGTGKTTLLERTINDMRNELPISVIEGDQETVFDAERIRATGCRAIQINTGTGCHLEARMIGDALYKLNPLQNSVVLIENVGNLVCPALFDLGERTRVVILSVTEGDDKPLKYPHMFRNCDFMIINKIDLLPYVEFDIDRCVEFARRVNPEMEYFTVSATTGENMDTWYRWLRQRMNAGIMRETVFS